MCGNKVVLIGQSVAERHAAKFGLDAGIPGLTLDAPADVSLSLDPSFSLNVGIDLSDGVAIEERFFIVEDPQNELTLDVTAQLDDPSLYVSINVSTRQFTYPSFVRCIENALQDHAIVRAGQVHII